MFVLGQCFLKCGLHWNGCGYGLGSRDPGWLEDLDAQLMMAIGDRVCNCPEEEPMSPVTANWPGTWSATILAVSSLCVGYRSWMYYFDLIVVADGLKGWVRLARILRVLDRFVGGSWSCLLPHGWEAVAGMSPGLSGLLDVKLCRDQVRMGWLVGGLSRYDGVSEEWEAVLRLHNGFRSTGSLSGV